MVLDLHLRVRLSREPVYPRAAHPVLGDDGMADDWLQRRHQRSQERVATEKQNQLRQQKAADSYDAEFDRLQKRVQTDVVEYNRLFTRPEQRAAFRSGPRQFSVVCGRETVTATGTGGTIIKLVWVQRDAQSPRKSEFIEVVVDDQENLRYKHNDKLLADVSDASESILGTVLSN